MDLKSLRILHLDDDPFELDRLKASLAAPDLEVEFSVTSVLNETNLKKEAEQGKPDVVLLDVDLGDGLVGHELASYLRKTYPNFVIIMCSGHDDMATIKECLMSGADDFISKRSERGELALRILNSYRLASLKRGQGIPGAQAHPSPEYAGDTTMHIAKRIPRILKSAISAVHINGESGTGKEVVADLFASQQPAGVPFIKVNCGAIAPTLLESELFGHVKGAFTGANSDRRGYIEAASGGWIFLDEIATLSSTAQVALLRTIENQEVIRVGDNKSRKVMVRYISATNESLPNLVEQNKFRGDLWQRLCETEIILKPLRERPSEIEAIVSHFCRTMPGGPYRIDEAAMGVLCAHPWAEGNIRELRNCLRAMTELHVDKLLTPLAIPERIWERLSDHGDQEQEAPELAQGGDSISIRFEPGGATYERLSDLLLLELVRLHAKNGRVSLRSLSRDIGMSRSTLSTRLKSLVQKEVVELKDLTELVGISEAGGK